MNFSVRTVQSVHQLRQVYAFAAPILGLPVGKHTLEYYSQQFAIAPQLLIFAERDGRICGCMLASVEDDHVLVGPVAVAEDSRRAGIGSAMIREAEQRSKEMGQHTLILGALEEAEIFYLSCGFQPNLFIQLPKSNSVKRLRSVNDAYEVVWESQQGGWARLMLRTPRIDKDLQREYERRFPDCSAQYVFVKHV